MVATEFSGVNRYRMSFFLQSRVQTAGGWDGEESCEQVGMVRERVTAGWALGVEPAGIHRIISKSDDGGRDGAAIRRMQANGSECQAAVIAAKVSQLFHPIIECRTVEACEPIEGVGDSGVAGVIQITCGHDMDAGRHGARSEQAAGLDDVRTGRVDRQNIASGVRVMVQFFDRPLVCRASRMAVQQIAAE